MPFQTKALYDQVVDEFARRIVSGEWKPGPSIPSEQELAQELQLSVGTIRKALDILESRYLISRRRGRGTFVVDHSADQVPTRFTKLRQDAFGAANCAAIVRRAGLEECNSEERERLKIGDDETCIRVELVRTLGAQIYMTEKASLPARLFPRFLEIDPTPARITEIARLNGLLAFSAVEQVSVRPLPEQEALDLELPAGTAVLFIDRIVRNEKGRPIEWRRGYVNLIEGISYTVEIS